MSNTYNMTAEERGKLAGELVEAKLNYRTALDKLEVATTHLHEMVDGHLERIMAYPHLTHERFKLTNKEFQNDFQDYIIAVHRSQREVDSQAMNILTIIAALEIEQDA